MSTTLKRQLESDLSTPERPLKRKSTSSSSPIYRYPYIPSSPTHTPYPDKPFDSPSNPFGRKHTLALTSSLPPSTAFGKHLPLRFQLYQPNARKAGFHKEGVGRIAQVPLNYTFHHLRYLIAFFFGAEDDVGDGHLFEVMRDTEVDTQAYNVGVIKKGEPWIRLSGDKNPYLYKNDWEVEDEERNSQNTEEDEEGWKWEAEEDFSLASVWTKKSRASGIIYYHDASQKSGQVHITLASNDDKVQRRKGRGNTPYVFWARGLVQLSALSVRKLSLQAELAPGNWNVPDNAFEQFFRANSAVPFSGFFDEDDDDVDFSSSPVRCLSTPSLATSTSSSVTFSSSPLSTPAKETSQYRGSASAREYAVPKYTPAPRPVHRKRLGDMERRMHLMKRKSMEALNEEIKDDAVPEIDAETAEETEEDELTEDIVEELSEEDRMIRVQAEMMERMSIPVKKSA